MKKLLSLIFVMEVFINSFGQSTLNQPLEKTINSVVVFNAMNTSEKRIPLFFAYPDFISGRKIPDESNPVFFDASYYESKKSKSLAGLLQREIIENIGSTFVPYIPEDSSMTMRFFNKKKLLFEIGMRRKKDTLIFTQSNPAKSFNKKIVFKGETLISVSFYNALTGKKYQHELSSDSTRTINRTTSKHGHRQIFKRVIKYKDGLIHQMDESNLMNGVEKIMVFSDFSYDMNQKPEEVKTWDKDGYLTQTTKYTYNDEQLLRIENVGKNESFIEFTYDTNGNCNSTTWENKNKPRRITYFRRGINDLDIKAEKLSGSKSAYLVRIVPNLQERVSEMKLYELINETTTTSLLKHWQFDYDDKGNLKRIRLLKPTGAIKNEINIEYLFGKFQDR